MFDTVLLLQYFTHRTRLRSTVDLSAVDPTFAIYGGISRSCMFAIYWDGVQESNSYRSHPGNIPVMHAPPEKKKRSRSRRQDKSGEQPAAIYLNHGMAIFICPVRVCSKRLATGSYLATGWLVLCDWFLALSEWLAPGTCLAIDPSSLTALRSSEGK